MADHPVNPDIRLLDGRFYAEDPHPHFTWMRANAPVYHDAAGAVWGIATHADIQRISRDPTTFSNASGMRPDSPPLPSMINMDDPEHKRRRNLVNKGFTPRRVADHEQKIREICADLLSRAQRKDRFDFVREVAAPLPMIMIGDMLGVAPEDRDDLLRWSDDMVSGTSLSAPPATVERAIQAFAEYSTYNRRVVAERHAQARDDLISTLVHATIEGDRLDDEELLHETLLILVGGDETTRHVITGGMLQLLRHPAQMALLAAHPERIACAVEEMLRWVSPIQNMARTATRDVELRGQTIRAGDKLLLLYPSANRDEQIFAEPFAFDVERRPNDHLAFGGFGAHFCLGASLARLELRVMFEEIVRRIPLARLVDEGPLPWRNSNFITGIEEMQVEV